MERPIPPSIASNIPVELSVHGDRYEGFIEEFSCREAQIAIFSAKPTDTVRARDRLTLRFCNIEQYSDFCGVVVRRLQGVPMRILVKFIGAQEMPGVGEKVS